MLSRDPLRVLLLSPLRDLDPFSGDVVYTEELLARPPDGVTYTTYADAIEDGSLVEHGTRRYVASKHGPRRAVALIGAGARRVNHQLRRGGLGFRETVRHFEVRPGRFDLIHVHVFHVRFHGDHPPFVHSSAGPLAWVYLDARRWSAARVSLARRIDLLAAGLTDATLCAERPGRASRTIAFSEYLRSWLVNERRYPPTTVDVVANFVPDPLTESPDSAERCINEPGPSLAFVARDFDAKGGDLLLSAHERLRERHPHASLIIVGSPPRLDPLECQQRGIRWLEWVPRHELLNEILPKVDVLVHPSRFDGLPFGPMEALALGIPLVVSDYRALPEMVEGGAGLVSGLGDVDSLTEAIDSLLDPRVHARASAAARQLYLRRYSAESQREALSATYRTSLGITPGGVA